MHRVTLAFDDDVLEREYLGEQAQDHRASVRFAALAFASVFLAFGVWDSFVLKPYAPSSLLYFQYAFYVVLALLVASFSVVANVATFARGWEWVVVVVNLLLGAGMAADQVAVLPGMRWRYLVSVIVGGLTVHAVWGLRFLLASACQLTMIAMYTAAMLVFAPLSPFDSIDRVMLLAAAMTLGMIVSHVLETARRRQFLQERLLADERAKSELLLRNMLPQAIAERLKREPGAIADSFDAVTVLFADIVGFTPLSARMPPRELVHLLNEVFSTFDEMARRHGLEKIKTIGDAYMVVGGLPEPRPDHAAAVASLALEMAAAIARVGDGHLTLRIGIHSGPVVAGVIGTSKYSYDLWGDTVNTASRMESHGAPGEIHVTDACRLLLGEGFTLEERGVVEVKGKGPMRTWWLKARGD